MIESTIRTHAAAATQLLIIDPPAENDVTEADEIKPWLEQGWKVVDANPRVTEQGAKWLVTLCRDNRTPIPYVVDAVNG